jgi:hypothetical protein
VTTVVTVAATPDADVNVVASVSFSAPRESCWRTDFASGHVIVTVAALFAVARPLHARRDPEPPETVPTWAMAPGPLTCTLDTIEPCAIFGAPGRTPEAALLEPVFAAALAEAGEAAGADAAGDGAATGVTDPPADDDAPRPAALRAVTVNVVAAP